MSQEVYRISRTRDAESLRAAFRREGCPVCTVVLEDMEMAMGSWNWELPVQHLATDQGTSRSISSSPGQSPGKKTWWQRLVSTFRPSIPTIDPASLYAGCPFCRTRTRTEQHVIETLVTLFAFEETQALFCQSTGLCRLHVEQALRFAQQQPEARRKAFLACQRACLQRTLEEVREQVRKHDYRFANEPRGDEMTTWRRAAELCAGNRGVY